MTVMPIYAPAEPWMGRGEVMRWSVAAVIVLLVHVSVAWLALHPAEEDDADAGSPVAMIDLAPVAAAPPAPESDLAPGPDQQAESQEAVLEKTAKAPEVEPLPDTTMPNPEVALPPPEPPNPEEKVEQQPQDAAPVPTAPVSVPNPAERAAAPPEGRVARANPAAVMNWQRSLVARLQRYKRYPPQARDQHEQGTASLAFAMDRQGRVVSSRIVRSSGSPLLDEETLAMIRRAQPLPVPPADVTDAQLSFVVPIHYAVR